MQEQLTTYKVSKLALEKGFDVYSEDYFDLTHPTLEYVEETEMCGVTNESGKRLKRYTQTQLRKWLREKFKIHINITNTLVGLHDIEHSYEIYQAEKCALHKPMLVRRWKVWEDALEIALEKVLKLLPNN